MAGYEKCSWRALFYFFFLSILSCKAARRITGLFKNSHNNLLNRKGSSSIALWTSGGASRVVIPIYDKGRPAATHTSNPSFFMAAQRKGDARFKRIKERRSIVFRLRLSCARTIFLFPRELFAERHFGADLHAQMSSSCSPPSPPPPAPLSSRYGTLVSRKKPGRWRVILSGCVP